MFDSFAFLQAVLTSSSRVFARLRGVYLIMAAAPVLLLNGVAPDLIAASPSVAWTTFQDPFERAFTMDVPRGWTVRGGLFRLGYGDWRPMLDLQSPDGRTDVRLGDVSVPSYSVPDRFHSREGEPYDLGAQAQMTVAAYRSGREFALLYARARFLGACRSLIVDTAGAPPPVKDKGAPSRGLTQSSFGEITYRCQTGEGERIAYAYSRTALYSGIWQVPVLASFVTPPEEVALVRSILLRCSESVQTNSEWLRYQQGMDEEGLAYQRQRQQGRMRALAQQAQQFEERMHSMQNQVKAFETRQNAQAAQVQGFSNALTGVTPTRDPLTGEFRRVWTGPRSGYWTNGRGDIVNANTAPGPGWHALSQSSQP